MYHIYSLQGEKGDTGHKGEPGFIVSSQVVLIIYCIY